MNDVEAGSQALGVLDSLRQLVGVLGFHDLTSFFAVSVFSIAALAFLICGGIVLIKKRRERIAELEKIVAQVQKEFAPKEPPIPSKPLENLPIPKPLVAKKEVKPALSERGAQEKPPQQAEHQTKVVEIPLKQEKIEEVAVEALPKATIEPALVQPEVASIAKPDQKKELGAALKNTRGGFIEKLSRLFSRGAEISDADFEEMEAILFTADIGVKTAQKLLDILRDRVRQEKNADKNFLRSVLKEEMRKILESANSPINDGVTSPQVIMFVGVNGAGKTTSIGKLGAQFALAGKKVLFGAGDTFRAAAVKQLSIWAERAHADVVSGKENSDSASVLFEAIEKAKNTNVDVVLCDTAGRLHTKVSLMDELKKVHRVVQKAQVGAPHQVLLVIDATMGQNAINQAREFAQATPLTGVVLSKLDGTAKGGVALGIVDELKVPIRYVGIGEQVSDLKDFDAKLFVDALFDEA